VENASPRPSVVLPTERSPGMLSFLRPFIMLVQPQGTVNTGLLSVVLSVNHGLVQLYHHAANGPKMQESLSPPIHTRRRRHVKVRGAASPFDGNLVYWARRLRHHPLTRTTLGWLLQRQGGACARCGLLFNDEDCIEIDHDCPTVLGGTPTSANMQALHRHCHDKKTAHDGSIQRRVAGTHDKTP